MENVFGRGGEKKKELQLFKPTWGGKRRWDGGGMVGWRGSRGMVGTAAPAEWQNGKGASFESGSGAHVGNLATVHSTGCLKQLPKTVA